jgi:tetratricopeptide (TPR) repeat protein
MGRDRPFEISVGTVLADARPSDPPGLVIAKQRVAAELFGSTEVSGIGRFQLLNRLGAGGMGVIYAAHDPQLDRTVAVKLVHLPGRDSATALAEGKALARLSHPNVVPIYDVGFAGEHLYIVMELVLGRTLRRWAQERTAREIVKAYRQAGDALAAAHAAGLVHRDFKPENAIMGTDGRVRVVDFGLACEATDPTRPQTLQRAGAGTPKYMPPEQVIGGEITPAADQYGFCTSLAEALKGCPGGVPRWLQPVIDRGSAPYPTDRFPSMAELLKALGRDPAIVRRRWLAGAAVAAAGVAAFVAGRSTLSARAEACGGGEARIASVWGSGGGRVAALARLSTLGDYGRSVQPRLEAQLREHESRWAAGYRNACEAHAQGVQSGDLLDRRMACLERDRAALTSMAELVQGADAKALPGLVLAAHALPDPNACEDLDSLLTNVEPPPAAIAGRVAETRARLAGARVQLAAGRYSQARAVAQQAVAEVRKLNYPPLLAEALLLAGHATMAMDERPAAVVPLTEAYTLAFQAGDQSLGVEAWARRAWAQGTSVGGDASLSGLDVVEAAAAHRSVSRFSRALLYNNVGSVNEALERRDRARTAFARALREAEEVRGAGAAELLSIRLNLGVTTEDPDRRDQLLGEGVAEKARALGDDHPDTLVARWQQGLCSGPFATTVGVLTLTCPKLEPHNRVLARRCWSELAYVRGEQNDSAGALEAIQRAASIEVSEIPLPSVHPYLRFWRGEAARASSEFAAALQALPATDSEPWWDRLERADLELGRGRAERAAGRLADARLSLGVAVNRLIDVSRKTSYSEMDRRLGRARAELAKVLAATGAPPREIAKHAAPAAAWLRRAGGTAA